MNGIKLNFINHSNDVNNSSVVIFQKNAALEFDEETVAWTVIQNCGQGENHPFSFGMDQTVSSADSYGNFTPQLTAMNGQSFDVVHNASGDALQHSQRPATSPSEIQVRNQMTRGAISANIYRNGKLLATKTGIAPGQMAVFEFKPTIYIGVVSQLEEGEVMDAAILSEINTEISLLGISSADIVMTGGGPGPSATAFNFTLENINKH